MTWHTHHNADMQGALALHVHALLVGKTHVCRNALLPLIPLPSFTTVQFRCYLQKGSYCATAYPYVPNLMHSTAQAQDTDVSKLLLLDAHMAASSAR